MSRTHRGRSAHGPLAVICLGSLLTFGWAAETMAQFNPYFGQNRVKYDDFDWHIYETEHFEIFYYPELEQHLERVASYAESAYAQVSADLTHDLATLIPLVVIKTHSEFEQQNVIPGAVSEGVGAFAEPFRRRILLPIDEPPDQLYRLITHELTHQFAFDIIPRSAIRQGIPLWVDEGLADYMAGIWRPLDLMQVRDAALADILPEMSQFDGYGNFSSLRVVYNLGHAAFEFMEERWGKEGVREFLFSLRKTAIGGGGDIYDDAFDIPADEFDNEFEDYIRERFQEFRDKERPDDYGRDLAPNPLETNFVSTVSIEPSPSGDLMAAYSLNRKEGELDIVLLSTSTGEVVANLTEGFNQKLGFESFGLPLARFNQVPWMSWSPIDDRLGYFVRKGKFRSLVLQNIVTHEVERLIPMDMVDEPESPDISPNGRTVAFSALQGAVGDIYLLDLDTEAVTNLTEDGFADYAPTFSPDGSYLVYVARISGNNKLFKLDLETIREFIASADASRSGNLATVLADLETRGLAGFAEIDLSIVRGLAYYTGVVFEVFDAGKSLRSVAGGGRYDSLISIITDGSTDLPATGYAMGDCVISELIKDTAQALLQFQAWKQRQSTCEVYLIIADDSKRPEAIKLVNTLREAGIATDYPLSPTKVNRQFKAADQTLARFALVVGSEFPELKLKNLNARSEESIAPNADVIEVLKTRLSEPDGPLIA